MLIDPLKITLLIIDAFEKLNIPYFIGGSLASALHGSARSTLDADIVADIKSKQVKFLVEIFNKEFYIDEEMIFDAIENQGSFNIIHLATSFKIDVFILKNRQFDQTQFQRRRLEDIENVARHQVYVTTAEDIILVKLEWYRMGGEISDRQWKDILGVLNVQGEKLDMIYLRNWAVELNVNDLLDEALIDVL